MPRMERPRPLLEPVAESVVSRDGTRLVVERSGTGPPLVLVPGGVAQTAFAGIIPLLAPQTTLYVVHRRGWGGSGDGPDYSMEREAEDVLAVLDWVGKPTALLGASFGGRCVLEAVIRGPRHLNRLIVWEPTLFEPGRFGPLYARIEALVAAGERDEAVAAFFREASRMPEDEIARRRRLPEWPGRMATIHLLARGGRAAEETPFPYERLQNVMAPTLLPIGGESSAHVKETARRLAAAMPHSRVVELPGQRHFAMQTAPDLFSRVVLAFLNGEA